MKKISVLTLMLLFAAAWTSLSAQSKVSLENRQGKRMAQKEVNVDQIIQRMEERKAQILLKLNTRFEKLNEKLSVFSERIDNASERLANLRNGTETDGNQKAQAEKRLAERKVKATERFNKFKTNIATRKKTMLERIEQNEQKFMSKIQRLEGEKRERVVQTYERMKKEVKAEAEKLANEAIKKIEATYNKIMAL
jgi:Skp family chaperone for outer membrane proteins